MCHLKRSRVTSPADVDQHLGNTHRCPYQASQYVDHDDAPNYKTEIPPIPQIGDARLFLIKLCLAILAARKF
jgi:hypothetical protein